jgi:hypothetical protein
MQMTNTHRLGNRVVEFIKRLLAHRLLPVSLAAAAVVAMLPALKTGLAWDDLVQRPFQFKASELPAQTRELFPPDTGSLRGVLSGLFGKIVNPEQVALARDYGILGWWGPDGIRCGLWRPLTAFTHWVDYRLFPDCPALMHAHNIAWFAAAVFLAAIIYRLLAGPAWIAGLAGILFLLDKNTYFPVMFVANRGFMSAVCYPKQIQERLEASKTLPTIVVRGENDKLFMLRRADEERTGRTIESLNPASRFIIKPGEGHSEMTNYWAENLRYILQFKRQ